MELPTNVTRIGETKTRTGQVKSLFSVVCINCGQPRNITRQDHAIRLSKRHCKKCSNKDNHPQGEHHGIRLSWFNKFVTQAQIRGLDWSIDLNYCADLLKTQNSLCALSGLPIQAHGDFDKITASLDRINNKKGYVPGNVQFVHKKVNMMRGSLDIEEFVSLCFSVANKVKW